MWKTFEWEALWVAIVITVVLVALIKAFTFANTMEHMESMACIQKAETTKQAKTCDIYG